jgi:hypothetical protein
MQASPAILNEDPKVFGIRIYDPGNGAVWAGQPVTVESRGGKSWGAKVGQLVRVEKDGDVGVYTDAKSHDRAIEAGVVLAGEPDEANVQAGRKVAAGVAADDIANARRLIVKALTMAENWGTPGYEATAISADAFALALDVFDRLAGTETEPPFDPAAWEAALPAELRATLSVYQAHIREELAMSHG